ncbi:MAG TPA: DUF4169 family protein [Phenylobacterium sp.]|uniref:DUF4169 family protein n=1 Tax=Phenylobacterium sp. TaxID=1871053 RepID=UPI002D6BBDE2|nr:DUF4169 family protein [Phenylobacterium sp.]HZZ67209.1 DUF4169 family protein [Phenylobacterium sp.]
MVEPINLNKARKARAKEQAKAKGAQNRSLFGLKKTEKIVAEMEAARASRKLDQAKRDD